MRVSSYFNDSFVSVHRADLHKYFGTCFVSQNFLVVLQSIKYVKRISFRFAPVVGAKRNSNIDTHSIHNILLSRFEVFTR